MFCPTCEKQIPDESTFCPACRARIAGAIWGDGPSYFHRLALLTNQPFIKSPFSFLANFAQIAGFLISEIDLSFNLAATFIHLFADLGL